MSVALMSASLGLGVHGTAQARDSAGSTTVAIPEISRSALPVEAQHTERLILAGGPFPYGKDGTVFGNRERLLSRQARGYYREYTVPTPGARNRGARRIVCGGQQVQAPDACFYTADHYASFKRIVK
ncbi:MAG: ribonuclease [Ideonella sp.]|nr:ribonuclease [Ideonella sp.]